MDSIKILIADDHAMIRDGIKHLLEEIGNVCFEEAGNGAEAIEKYARTQPNLVIMDLSMPIMGGLEAAHQILREDESARIIIHSMYDSDTHVSRCIEEGVKGYVAKGESRGELNIAVKSVLRGETYFSMIAKNSIMKNIRRAAEMERPSSNITPREREIIKLIEEGLTSHQIAERLFISPRTVDTHRANLMKKLNARNTIELLKKLKESEYSKIKIW